MRPFQFLKQNSVAQVVSRKNAKSNFVAGGTNLVDLMKKDIAQPEQLIDVSSALSSKIERIQGGLRIGAAAKNSAVTLDPEVLKNYPLLAKAILAGASPQIRNMASCGGNLLQRTRCPYFYELTTPCNKRVPQSGCSAINGENKTSAIIGHSNACVAVHPSDFCVALAALDAKVIVQDKSQKQQVIRFKDFHRLPGDAPHLDTNLPVNAIVAFIDVPENRFQKHYHYLKVRDRSSYAFALISVAAALDISNGMIKEARLASGGVAHKPWRWYEAENFLKGKPPTTSGFTQAAEIALKDLKPLSQNGFKRHMLRGTIITALQNCLNV